MVIIHRYILISPWWYLSEFPSEICISCLFEIRNCYCILVYFIFLKGKGIISKRLVGWCVLVNWWPFCSWSKWPFALGTVGPTSLMKLSLLMVGHVVKLPLLIALWKVDSVGLKAHAWRYWAKGFFKFFCWYNDVYTFIIYYVFWVGDCWRKVCPINRR